MGYHDPYMVWYRGITRRWQTQYVAAIDYLVDSMAQINFLSTSDDYASAMPEIQSISMTALRGMHAEYRVPGHHDHAATSDWGVHMTPAEQIDPFPHHHLSAIRFPFPTVDPDEMLDKSMIPVPVGLDAQEDEDAHVHDDLHMNVMSFDVTMHPTIADDPEVFTEEETIPPTIQLWMAGGELAGEDKFDHGGRLGQGVRIIRLHRGCQRFEFTRGNRKEIGGDPHVAQNEYFM